MLARFKNSGMKRNLTLCLTGMLTMVAAFAWTGCGEENATVSGPEPGDSIVDVTVVDQDALPPEAQEKLDLVLDIFDDILSEDPDVVAQGFDRFDELQPGSYDAMVNALHDLFGSASDEAFWSENGTAVIDMPMELMVPEGDGDPKYCIKIKIILTFKIHKGSFICKEWGGPRPQAPVFRSCNELPKDTVITYPITLEFECEPLGECQIEHSSITTISLEEHTFKWSKPDANNNGKPDSEANITVSGSARIEVEVTTCDN